MTHTQKDIHNTHTHTHTPRRTTHKNRNGDTQELNSEGNEKRRRQRESRVNSGAEKKSPVTNIDTKKAMHMFGMVDEIAKIKINYFRRQISH